MLIFKNDGFNIQKAWLIIPNAFADKDVPNLNKISDADAKKLAEKLATHNGYETAAVITINAANKGLFAVTAKEVEIDTNGDGKPDETAKADTQMASTVSMPRRSTSVGMAVIFISRPEWAGWPPLAL